MSWPRKSRLRAAISSEKGGEAHNLKEKKKYLPRQKVLDPREDASHIRKRSMKRRRGLKEKKKGSRLWQRGEKGSPFLAACLPKKKFKGE